MEDRELEARMREVLAPDALASERVWRRLRKPEPRWLPSLPEISVAALAGLAALAWIAAPRPVVTRTDLVHHESPIERTFVASIRTTTTLR